MPEPLTPDQRIALIERIESQETARRRRALWITWASIAIAAIVLMLIVFGARRELVQSQTALQAMELERARIKEDIEGLNVKKVKAEEDLKETQAALKRANDATARAVDAAARASIQHKRATELAGQATDLAVKLASNKEMKAAQEFKGRVAEEQESVKTVQREVAALSSLLPPKLVSSYLIEITGIDAIGVPRDDEWNFQLRRNDSKAALLSFAAGGRREPREPGQGIYVGRTLLGSGSKRVSLSLEEGSGVDLAIDATPSKVETKNRGGRGHYNLVTWQQLRVPVLRAQIPIAVQAGRSEGVLLVEVMIRRSGPANVEP